MHSLSYFQLELQILPNAVHIYRQELTAKQIIALCASHVTLYYATYLFLKIGCLFVLSYFFPSLSFWHQPGRKVKEDDQKEKYKRQGRVHVAKMDNRLPVSNRIQTSRKKKWRPGKRWPSPCRGLYLWSMKEEDTTVAYLHTTCKLNVEETYYKSILAVILYWPYKFLKALHLLPLLWKVGMYLT
jgi:hypothetical protein